MSTESTPGNERMPAAEAEAEAAAARALSDLAGSIEAGAVPYDRLVGRGRRRLRRRRLLTVAAAGAVAVAVAGAASAFGGYGAGTGGAAVVAAPTVAAAPSTPPAASGAPSAASGPSPSGGPSGAARDPFTPIRVKIGEGSLNGRTWQAWVAEWPSPTTERDALRQAETIRAERGGVGPDARSLLPRNSAGKWLPDYDLANLYYTVDGKRQAEDVVQSVRAPGGPSGGGLGGAAASLGLKDTAKSGLPPVLVGSAAPDVAKIVITWETGGSTEVVPVTAADSTMRWYGLMAKPGSGVRNYTDYAADGSVLRSSDHWLRTN
ncbi:hypothetical protein AB0C76_23200 [Kitasatospora sp. NPDC048722]|uniref:hypothetical protein n=1 Tax=Kitasatospora sp. NPDC048722 TaxID=3155639 RepID=UPI0033DEBB60